MAKKKTTPIKKSLVTVTGSNSTKVVDVIKVYGKKNTINARKGNDQITVFKGDGHKINGGAGNDTIKISKGNSHKIYGNAGDDSITLSVGKKTVVHGNAGVDTITIGKKAGTGNKMYGDDGNDKINIQGGSSNKVWGGKGVDTITLSGGKKNFVYGNEGDDRITITKTAGVGNKIYGNSGNDRIKVKGGNNNTISGDTGNDIITVSGGSKNNIGGNAGNDKITITKTAGNGNRIFGDAGRDTIFLNGGTQTTDGGADNDVITVNGGTGHILAGGKGKDSFVINKFSGNITINDYLNGTDSIQLGVGKVKKSEIFGSDTILTLADGNTITLKNATVKTLTYLNADNKKVSVKSVSTQQNVIKSFMKALDESTLLVKSSEKALDAAVKFASNSKYKSWKALLESFISDVRQHGSKEESAYEQSTDDNGNTVITPGEATHAFLKDYCGIDLMNKDTGAITGLDAGGAKVKTPESIVPENGTRKNITSTETTISGLTFHWPKAENKTQKSIIDGIGAWWAKEGLRLCQESFGLTFAEKGTTVSDINVKFVNEDSNTLAQVDWTSSVDTGKTSRLVLNINMDHFNKMNLNDANGSTGDETKLYLDRVLAHELTHAVMAANITGFNNVPDCLSEGSAELVHGIDDFRTMDIIALAQVDNIDTLQEALSCMDPYTSYEINYAGGYMLLRYFAKQVADSLDDSISSSAPLLGSSANRLFETSSSLSFSYKNSCFES